MRRQIKGDRDTLPSCRKRLAVKSVTLLSRRESCILPNGPAPTRIHRCLRAADVWAHTGHCIGVGELSGVLSRVEDFHGDVLGRKPRKLVRRYALALLLYERSPILFVRFTGVINRH